MLTEDTRWASIRRMESGKNGSSVIQNKKTVSSPAMAAFSIQTVWHHALVVGTYLISIELVAREEPAAGTTIRHIKFDIYHSNIRNDEKSEPLKDHARVCLSVTAYFLYTYIYWTKIVEILKVILSRYLGSYL